jgi:hypothetical protein
VVCTCRSVCGCVCVMCIRQKGRKRCRQEKLYVASGGRCEVFVVEKVKMAAVSIYHFAHNPPTCTEKRTCSQRAFPRFNAPHQCYIGPKKFTVEVLSLEMVLHLCRCYAPEGLYVQKSRSQTVDISPLIHISHRSLYYYCTCSMIGHEVCYI